MIEAIRNYFLNFTSFPTASTIGVDSLLTDVNDFSIDITPCNPVLERYVNGVEIKQQTFVLSGRFNYENDNTSILNFFLSISDWIKENNKNGVFPVLGENKVSEDLQMLSNGYLINHDGTEAKYQIQLKLVYREGDN